VAVGETFLSVYAYSPNVGLVRFGTAPANGHTYTNTGSDHGVNQDSFGNLDGYAWGEHPLDRFRVRAPDREQLPSFLHADRRDDRLRHSPITGWINLATNLITVERLAGNAINLRLSEGGFLVEICSVNDIGGDGIISETVRFFNAQRIQGQAIRASIISDTIGHSLGSQTGIEGLTFSNSGGSSVSGQGITARLASNCQGSSTSNIGLFAESAQNCYGSSSSGSSGLLVSGTASFCRGKRNGGIAIQAGIAVACTVDGTGTVSSTQKHLGTP